MRLLALHGLTLNGAEMRRQLAAVQEAVPDLVIDAPDAPHLCSEAAVERLYALWDVPRPAPPHCAWWDASDDGRVYGGWEATRDQLRDRLADGPVGILGFSQGAIVATALAALAEHGEMPPIAYVIPIAGRAPRSDVLRPYFERPLVTPSLHVWGENDTLAGDTPRALVERFASPQVLTWPGGHTLPTTREGIDALVRFIRSRHAA